MRILFRNKLIYLILLYLNLVICQKGECGSFLPQDLGSCSIYSNKDDLCCFLTTYNNNFYSSICYPIKATKYLYLDNKISLGGINYSVDCGRFTGTKCGTIDNPINFRDCSISSLSYNSCCFMKYDDSTSCVWLGNPNTGEIISNGITLICSAGYYYFNFILIFLIVFIIN
jgi:hypothetical protein